MTVFRSQLCEARVVPRLFLIKESCQVDLARNAGARGLSNCSKDRPGIQAMRAWLILRPYPDKLLNADSLSFRGCEG
jgi:hypothetical protein